MLYTESPSGGSDAVVCDESFAPITWYFININKTVITYVPNDRKMATKSEQCVYFSSPITSKSTAAVYNFI